MKLTAASDSFIAFSVNFVMYKFSIANPNTVVFGWQIVYAAGIYKPVLTDFKSIALDAQDNVYLILSTVTNKCTFFKINGAISTIAVNYPVLQRKLQSCNPYSLVMDVSHSAIYYSALH